MYSEQAAEVWLERQAGAKARQEPQEKPYFHQGSDIDITSLPQA